MEDDVVSVEPASLRGVPVQLPYPGRLELDVEVLNGQRVNVRVVRLLDWKALEKNAGRTRGKPIPLLSPDLQANDVAHATLSSHLPEGAYFVIVENPALDRASAPFEVRVRANLIS